MAGGPEIIADGYAADGYFKFLDTTRLYLLRQRSFKVELLTVLRYSELAGQI